MKSASTAVCTPQRAPAVGRVHRRDNTEVQLYLSKLRRLLPTRPGARRLTKLEVIQSVIEYICDLQYCLQMPLEAVDASVKSATMQMPSGAMSEGRMTVACGEREPVNLDRLCTLSAEVDEEELEEEDEMEEEDEEIEYVAETEAASSAAARAPHSSEDLGLPVPC